MLADILARYLEFYPEEAQKLALLQKQIKGNERLNDRRNFNGHITASAVILSSDKRKILLIHHKAYDQWQQPGGHWEKDEPNPFEAAKRECLEETGLEPGENIPLYAKRPLVPFDIDSHRVPARLDKKEPEHYHHDFRYVFLADEIKLSHQAEEVFAAGWFEFDAPRAVRVQKIIKKLKSAGVIA